MLLKQAKPIIKFHSLNFRTVHRIVTTNLAAEVSQNVTVFR
jgi:hypothetical protein